MPTGRSIKKASASSVMIVGLGIVGCGREMICRQDGSLTIADGDRIIHQTGTGSAALTSTEGS